MHYRRLGRSGLKVSEISLGTWLTVGGQLDEARSKKLIRAAYDQGINYFDSADINGNGETELVLGKAITGLPRSELVLSSKVFYPTSGGPNGRGLSRKHILESLHTSLRRMGTDYLDLYFCHRYDPDTPIEEVVRTMDILIRQGKILYWGTSEWENYQIAQAIGTARENYLTPPSMEQPQYNMFCRDNVEVKLAPLCKDAGLGLTVWGPLQFGILSGKYNDGIPAGSRADHEEMGWMQDDLNPDRIAIVRKLTALASSMGVTTAQLAIAWLLRRKEVSSVVTGATNSDQLHDNLTASEALEKLTDPVLERIERILGNYPDED